MRNITLQNFQKRILKEHNDLDLFHLLVNKFWEINNVNIFFRDEVKMEVDDQEEVYFVTDEEVVISEISDNNFWDKNSSDIFGHFQEDRRLNVSVATAEGSGIRTIVLHVPKDIK